MGKPKRGWPIRYFKLKVIRLRYPLGFKDTDPAMALSAPSAVFLHLFSALAFGACSWRRVSALVFSPSLSACSALS